VRAGTNYIGASIAKMMPLTMRILFNVMRQYERAHIGETQKDTQPALGGNNDMDVLSSKTCARSASKTLHLLLTSDAKQSQNISSALCVWQNLYFTDCEVR
jgi:hypothetical protein